MGSDKLSSPEGIEKRPVGDEEMLDMTEETFISYMFDLASKRTEISSLERLLPTLLVIVALCNAPDGETLDSRKSSMEFLHFPLQH